MSGVEVFQVIASAITVAELAVKITDALNDYLKSRRPKERRAMADEIRTKFESLRHVATNVRRALESCQDRAKDDRVLLDMDADLNITLVQFEAVLKKWHRALLEMQNSQTAFKAIQKALLKSRAEQDNAHIARLEKRIDQNIAIIQICLTSLNIRLTNSDNEKSRLEALLRQMNDLCQNVPLNQVLGVHASENESSGTSNDVDSAIDLDYDVHGIKPEVSWEHIKDAATTIISGPSPGHQNHDGRRSSSPRAASPVSDRYRIDDVPTPRVVLIHLIPALEEEVGLSEESHEYKRAIEAQVDLIAAHEEREKYYRIPFKPNDYQTMNIKLAELYNLSCDYRMGQKTTDALQESLLQSAGPSLIPAPAHWEADFNSQGTQQGQIDLQAAISRMGLYRSERENWQIIEAERYAKRAFHFRETYRKAGPTGIFEQVVNLLIDIYEELGKPVHAKVYSQFIPSHLRPRAASLPTRAQRRDSSAASIAASDTPRHQGKPSGTFSIKEPDSRTVFIEGALRSGKFDSTFNGKTPIECAVDLKSTYYVRALYHERANMNPGLLHAIDSGGLEMTRLLLDCHADIEAKGDKGLTPLLLAARGTGTNSPDILKHLIIRGADLDARGGLGWTALHYIAKNNKISMLRALLDTRPGKPGCILGLRTTCDLGKTPLHFAAEFGFRTFAEELLKRDPDLLNIKDSSSQTCFDIAVEQERYKFVKMLVEKYGVSYNRKKLPQTSSEIKSYLNKRFR